MVRCNVDLDPLAALQIVVGMNISVILGHPDPASFNHAIAQVAMDELRKRGHRVNFHDLHLEVFDPLLPTAEISSRAVVPPEITRHCDELAAADGIVIVHPNWWGMPPAIVTGWIDRVIRPGVAYRFVEGDSGEGVPVGLLKARAAVVFNTANTAPEREETVFGDPLEAIWKKCIFDLCGVKVFHREMFRVMITSTAQQRAEWLVRVRDIVARLF
jgi:NAD(P)H dehydrogenase (quinone)